jgi:hypothetical protein
VREIPGYPLWIGHAGDLRSPQKIIAAGIAAVISLAAEEPHATLPRDLLYCHFPVLDGAGNSRWLLCAAIDITVSLLRSRTPTLLCCGAGMSRSPAIAAAAISLVTRRTPNECLAGITQQGAADVSPALWQEATAALAFEANININSI